MKRAIVLLLLALPTFAQKKDLTLESIYSPSAKVYYSGAIQSGFQWLDDSTFIWPRTDEKGKLLEWQRFDVKSGKTTRFFDPAAMQKALMDAGLPEDEAAAASKSKSPNFDPKKSSILVEAANDLFLFSMTKQTAVRLTSSPAREEIATFGPDGQRVAFVRDHNLWTVDLATQRERQLTTDGGALILNGVLDWMYDEEIYGRGTERGYWWSPDSKNIALLRFDERDVPAYPALEQVDYHPVVVPQFYPKAGDPNPHVKLMIAPAGGGDLVTVDNDRYTSGDFLIVRVGWNGDGTELTYQIQNREQTWLDLDIVGLDGEGSRTILRETTKAWVDPIDNPTFLAGGSFLWLSTRDGYQHLYHYKTDGTLIGQVTKGEWEVAELKGVDEKNGWAYFTANERANIDLDVYRISSHPVGAQAPSPVRLSDKAGKHSPLFNPSFTHYLDSWNDIATPTQVRLHRADGQLVKVIDENPVAALASTNLTRPEFLQIKTRDGVMLDAMMIKPVNFDASKKYPVYEYHYGGPHAPEVRNAWRGTNALFLQLIANQGVIVWMCDNRAASGRSASSAWTLYKHLGEVELRDMEDGLKWLASQPYIDGSRMMTYGWSYGGFMTAYAMTHSKLFVAGIAGGSVTDWRDYDTVYTERLMLMPQNNPEGYKNSSPRFAAKNLHGHLLLIHGTVDDNVHPQNLIQFIYELEKAQVPFEMKLYPVSAHGVRNPLLVYDLEKTILEFVKRELSAGAVGH